MPHPSLGALTGIFLRIGNLTFGGGDPTTAALERELVGRRGWLTPEQYGLAFSLARITPGTNVMAFCAGVAWMLRGWRAAILAVLAVTIPSGALIIWLTHAFEVWRNNPVAKEVFGGMVAAAVGLTVAGAWLLAAPRFRRGWKRVLVFAGGAALLAMRFEISVLWILALAAAAGALWKDAG